MFSVQLAAITANSLIVSEVLNFSSRTLRPDDFESATSVRRVHVGLTVHPCSIFPVIIWEMPVVVVVAAAAATAAGS
jgi:hypothetical protein